VSWTETWYVVQISPKGADDWFRLTNETDDAPEAARKRVRADTEWDYKIVRVTQTEEDVEIYPAGTIVEETK